MKVSVIVPAFNEEKLLGETLRSIHAACGALEERGWASELVVCDNNSTDRTAAIAGEHGASVVFEPVNQIGRARNTGARAAHGEWLVFVDADSHPTRELFAELAEALVGGRCLAGGSTLRINEKGLPLAAAITAGWNLLSRVMKLAPGSFLFCDAAVFREIGGFNIDLYASEEIELFRRLKRVARARHRRIVILHRHPMATSGRKMHLYTPGEHLRFLIKTFFRFGAPLRKREECFTWYDGRR
jgi:glycosyltransferase involved in cell wall biosynthesis